MYRLRIPNGLQRSYKFANELKLKNKASGTCVQEQPKKGQRIQLKDSHRDLYGGEGRATKFVVTTTKIWQRYTREGATYRAAAGLNRARKCQVCKSVHTASSR